jgi:hypothetical protein
MGVTSVERMDNVGIVVESLDTAISSSPSLVTRCLEAHETLHPAMALSGGEGIER